MSELTFYYSPYSTAVVTQHVLAELEHAYPKNKPFTVKRMEISLQDGDTKKATFLSSVNPNGEVPAIVHDGVSIWESSAITMYLGETFGVDVGLYPALGAKRGEAMKWIVWTNVVLVGEGRKFREALKGGEEGMKEEKGQKALGDLKAKLRILDEALQGRDYLLGSGEYCLADTHVKSFCTWLTYLKIEFEDFANVKAWMGRVAERAALKDL